MSVDWSAFHLVESKDDWWVDVMVDSLVVVKDVCLVDWWVVWKDASWVVLMVASMVVKWVVH